MQHWCKVFPIPLPRQGISFYSTFKYWNTRGAGAAKRSNKPLFLCRQYFHHETSAFRPFQTLALLRRCNRMVLQPKKPLSFFGGGLFQPEPIDLFFPQSARAAKNERETTSICPIDLSLFTMTFTATLNQERESIYGLLSKPIWISWLYKYYSVNCHRCQMAIRGPGIQFLIHQQVESACYLAINIRCQCKSC